MSKVVGRRTVRTGTSAATAPPLYTEDGMVELEARITTRTIASRKWHPIRMACSTSTTVRDLKEALGDVIGIDAGYIQKVLCGGRVLSDDSAKLQATLKRKRLYVTLDEGQLSLVLYEQSQSGYTDRMFVRHILMGMVAPLLPPAERAQLRFVCRSWYLAFWTAHAPHCLRIIQHRYASLRCFRFFRAISLSGPDVPTTGAMLRQLSQDVNLNRALEEIEVGIVDGSSADALRSILRQLPQLWRLKLCSAPVECVKAIVENGASLRRLELQAVDCYVFKLLCSMPHLEQLQIALSETQRMWRGEDLVHLGECLRRLQLFHLDAAFVPGLNFAGLCAGMQNVRSLSLSSFSPASMFNFPNITATLHDLEIDDSIDLDRMSGVAMRYPGRLTVRLMSTARTSTAQHFASLCDFLSRNSAAMHTLTLNATFSLEEELLTLTRQCTTLEELYLYTRDEQFDHFLITRVLECGIKSIRVVDFGDTRLDRTTYDYFMVHRPRVQLRHSGMEFNYWSRQEMMELQREISLDSEREWHLDDSRE